MFIALDCDKNIVEIINATKEHKYYCPSCGEELIIKAKESVAVKPHFAHKKGTDCDDFSHDMSEWHLNWQNQFPKECREVVVENSNEKHRADVLINNTVIEFQHSPITAEEIARRNSFYLSCGYNMIWLFDASGLIKNEIDNSLDPAKCSENDFAWKRAKQQFAKPLDSRVHVFIQYQTETSIPGLEGKQLDVLLLLTKVESKNIQFFKTIIGFKENNQINGKYFYILPSNFVKQFYDSPDNDVWPVDVIIKRSIEYREWKQNMIRQQRRVVTVPLYIPRRRFRRF